MKHRLAGLLVLLMLLFAQAQPGSAREPSPSASDGAGVDVLGRSTRWLNQLINLEGVNPGQTSLAFDPLTNTPYISFYNSNGGDLWLAWRVGQGGSCGPNSSWQCEAVDTGGEAGDDVGSYNSLDVIRSGSTLVIGIAYHNVSAGGMKYLLRTCPASGIQNGCTTSIETITQGAADLGMGISLVLNPSGGAHIAYHGLDPDPSKGYFLGYAKQVNGSGSGCLGDYPEKWNCGVVDRGTGVNSASLDIDFSPNSGFAYISYYDAAGGNLKLAEENGSAWCGDVQGWRCEVIDGASGSDVGKFSDLNTDSAGAVRMAYYDAGGYLKYASPVGAGLGNCGESGEYQCDRIDAMSLGLEPRMLSLAMLNETTPVIAYYSFNPNTLESRLNVAKPAGSLLGNCGPEIPIYTWLCAKLSTAALNDKTGLWPSVGVNGKGFISIAYIRISDYTQGNGTLALGYEGYPVFLPMLIR